MVYGDDGYGGDGSEPRQSQYDTVSDVVDSKVYFASKILTPNRMD